MSQVVKYMDKNILDFFGKMRSKNVVTVRKVSLVFNVMLSKFRPKLAMKIQRGRRSMYVLIL